MIKKFVTMATAFGIAIGASTAFAEPVIQIWSCGLNDGHTYAEATDVSQTWLDAAKAVDGGADLNVILRFPLAADVKDGSFKFVLIAPDAKTWGTWIDTSGNDANLASVNAAWSEVAYCTGSSMWSAVNLQ